MKKIKIWASPAPITFFLVLAVLYISNLCGVSAVAHDSIFYINQIDTVRPMRFSYNPRYHSHHLLFNPLAEIWLAACRALGAGGPGDRLVALLNALFGLGALAVFYLLLRRRLGANRAFSLLGVLLPAFSYGFWFYSVSVEVYTVPLFFMTLLLYLLSDQNLEEKHFHAAGFWHGMAILFHQANALFGTVVLAAAWYGHKKGTLSLKKSLGNYFLVALPVTVIPYAAVMTRAVKLNSPADGWYWLTRYAHQPGFWQPIAFSTLLKALSGFGRAIFEAYFIFALPFFQNLLNQSCRDCLLWDEVFLVRELGEITAWLYLAAAALLIAVTVFLLLRSLPKAKETVRRHQRLFILTAVWLVTYSLFFFFWVPNNVEFWIPQSLCWWLLFLMLQQGAKKRRGTPYPALGLLGLLLFCVNYGGNIRFIKKTDNDLYHYKTARLAKHVRKGDLLILGPHLEKPSRSWTSESLYAYLYRYTDVEVLDLVELFRAARPPGRSAGLYRILYAVNRTLSRGRRVFVYKEVLEINRRTADYLRTPARLLDSLEEKYRDKWRRVELGGEKLYLIEAPRAGEKQALSDFRQRGRRPS